MNEQVSVLAGIVVASALALDGVAHAYWATGGLWPAQNKRALAQAILNINRERAFRPVTLIPLATLLFCGALLALARVHLLGALGQSIPSALLQAGTLIITAGLLARGVVGLVWALGLAASKSQLFYRLNVLLYTPACFILFLAAVLAARS